MHTPHLIVMLASIRTLNAENIWLSALSIEIIPPPDDDNSPPWLVLILPLVDDIGSDSWYDSVEIEKQTNTNEETQCIKTSK